MIDTQLALEARANLEWVAGQWGALKTRLRKSGGDPNAPRVTGSSDAPAPIDLHVSDLMHEITTTAVFYGRVLMEESGWIPDVGEMPGLLVGVAGQYGHFVVGEERLAYDFVDTAYEFRRKVEKVLSPREPRRYVGPCFQDACQGELYLHEGSDGGACPECGAEWTLPEQHAWLWREMDSIMLGYSEVRPALKIIGLEVSGRTWERWTSSGTEENPKVPKVKKAEKDDLYPFKDAVMLAARLAKYRDTRVGKAVAGNLAELQSVG